MSIYYSPEINGYERLTTIYSDLRSSLSGKDVPEDIKSRLLALHEENVNLKESYKTAQEKLLKARTVRLYHNCCLLSSSLDLLI